MYQIPLSDKFRLSFAMGTGFDFNLKAQNRHISNAGHEEPNGGIDKLFFVFGITKYFFQSFK